jgi:hypothetical protein
MLDLNDTTTLITLALARWSALYGEPDAETYRQIVAAAHEVNA